MCFVYIFSFLRYLSLMTDYCPLQLISHAIFEFIPPSFSFVIIIIVIIMIIIINCTSSCVLLKLYMLRVRSVNEEKDSIADD